MKRNRIIYAVLIFIVILLGLGSRSGFAPAFVKKYAGDALWALVAFLMFGFLFPRFSTAKIAIIAGLFSLAVELSQLYHAPWIDAIRRTRLGGLILGFGFLWSDLICYAVGIGAGAFLEYFGLSRPFKAKWK